MARHTSFRELINAARSRGRSEFEKPRSMLWVAEKCGISLGHIYHLLLGTRLAKPWTVAKLARGLGATKDVVQHALNKAQRGQKTQ